MPIHDPWKITSAFLSHWELSSRKKKITMEEEVFFFENEAT